MRKRQNYRRKRSSQHTEMRSPPQKVIYGVKAVSEILKNRPGLVLRVVCQKGAGRVELYELQ